MKLPIPTQAFKMIDRLAMLEILIRHGVRGKLLAWIGDYLYRRRAYICFQGTRSKTMHFRKGTPKAVF